MCVNVCECLSACVCVCVRSVCEGVFVCGSERVSVGVSVSESVSFVWVCVCCV